MTETPKYGNLSLATLNGNKLKSNCCAGPFIGNMILLERLILYPDIFPNFDIISKALGTEESGSEKGKE